MEQVNNEGHAYYFFEANNFDMKNNRNLIRRDGFRVLHHYPNNTLHSLWSHNDNCFFMKDDGLYRLDSAWNLILLQNGFNQQVMNYTYGYDKIFFTNNTTIGYIEGNTLSFLPPAVDLFKRSMPAGHLIECYNHCLYVAVGNIIYCSDPTYLFQYDIRHNLLTFPSRITMLKAVDDGLWVSDMENIYFLNGSTFFDFSLLHRMNTSVFERSATTIDGSFLGTDSVGLSVLMLTAVGLGIGSNGGTLLTPTSGRYQGSKDFMVYDAGIRITENKYQYIIMGYDYNLDELINIQAGFQIPSMESEFNHVWTLPLLQVNMNAITS
jgi:hypothetical protein